MSETLTPYPAYKDSTIPWLGQIPAHWEILPLCAIAKPKSITGQQDRDLLSVYLDRGVVRFSDVKEKRTNVTSDDLSRYQAVDPGDLVLNNQQAWRGSVGVSRHTGIVSPAYLVLSLDARINSNFANLLFRERTMVGQYLVCSKGVGSIQRNLYWPYLKRVPIFLPPPDEQAAIARYLDYVDRRIRRYIRAKQQLIKLLTEQKQAIIHQAVTCGLNPNVPLKESGVEWLGQVPAHWEVMRSKRLFSVRNELARQEDIQLSATQAYGVIPQAEFENRVGRRVVQIFKNLDKRRHVEKNDFVISMRSFQGGLERAWTSGCIRSSYVILEPGHQVDVEYFFFLFKSYGYIQALQATADFIRDGQDLNFDNFCRVDLPIFSLEEQRTIANFLIRATSGIDEAFERTQHEIDLIREYRTRLIADVVTGKVDVRAAATSLPVEMGGEASLEEGVLDAWADGASADAASDDEAMAEDEEMGTDSEGER